MSPEQMQPEIGVDARADLYALGTIAYLMLGGKTPFTGDMMQLVMQKIMHKPPPLSSLSTDIPADVERVIMRSLEIEPARPAASVADWIDELENAAEDVEERKAGRFAAGLWLPSELRSMSTTSEREVSAVRAVSF